MNRLILFLFFYFYFNKEKRFFEVQNQLLIESTKNRKIDGILWWYEAWDATWQQYNPQITTDIENHYKTNVSNVRLFHTNYKKKKTTAFRLRLLTNKVNESKFTLINSKRFTVHV